MLGISGIYIYLSLSLLTTYGNVGRFTHVVAAIKPTHQFTLLRDDKHSWGNAVNGHNVTFGGNSQSGNDVNITTTTK